MTIFKGSGTALVTPMKENGDINYDSLERLIEDQIRNGSDALVVVGTSGEAPTLDDPEHLEAIRFSVEVTKGRLQQSHAGRPVCALPQNRFGDETALHRI